MTDERSAGGLSARSVLVFLVTVSLVAPTMVASGQTFAEWHQTQKFAPGDGDSSDDFGTATAVDGDLAVVGAPNHGNDDGADTGAVYVYARTLLGQWTQEAKLLAGDGDDGDRFGVAVSLDGDTLLVGAMNADDPDGESAGAAYVFTRTAPGAWSRQAKLVAGDGESGDNFGEAVSLDGDRALVGASLADVGGENAAGAAYVFARDATGAWTQQAQIVAPDGDATDQFGEGVSLDGDRAVVGAPSDHDPGAEDTGSAYLLQQSGDVWTVQTKFDNPEPNAEDQFGAELTLDGDVALVASPYDDSDGTDFGSVYAYAPDGNGAWSQEAELQGSDTGFLDSFGVSVALDGDRALVGAPYASNDNGAYAGESYLFLRDANGGWTEEAKLLANDGGPDDEFGAAAALDRGTALVGAPATFNFNSPGAAYVFGNLVEQVQHRTQDATQPGGTPVP